MTAVSVGADRSSTNPGAPSVLCGSSCVSSAATGTTAAVEPTGLTARLPNARSSGVSASAPRRAIADPEAAPPPPPGSAGLLANAPDAVSSTSGRWSRGSHPLSPSSSPSEASVDSDGDGDSSSGRPSLLCYRRRSSSFSRARICFVCLAALASFYFFCASVCARLIACRLASSGTGGGEARTSLIPCRNGKRT